MTIATIVPTYRRKQADVNRCLRSVRQWLGPEPIVVIDQNESPLDLPDANHIIQHVPGWPGTKRRLGAGYAEIWSPSMYLFIDDDVVLRDWSGIDEAMSIVERPATGACYAAFNKRGTGRNEPVGLGYTGGGILIDATTYWSVGGHGEDYLDDVELFARCAIAGLQNWRLGCIESQHRFGLSGGLRASLGVPKATASHKLSHLDEQYAGYVARDKSWLGFSLLPEKEWPA